MLNRPYALAKIEEFEAAIQNMNFKELRSNTHNTATYEAADALISAIQRLTHHEDGTSTLEDFKALMINDARVRNAFKRAMTELLTKFNFNERAHFIDRPHCDTFFMPSITMLPSRIKQVIFGSHDGPDGITVPMGFDKMLQRIFSLATDEGLQEPARNIHPIFFR